MDYSEINFVIVGPGKTGTSWLTQCLREHSKVFVSSETNFLTHHRERGWEFWQEYFKDRGNKTCIGEYANWYCYFNGIPRELGNLNPTLKIIFSVRDPVKRTISFYNHDLRWTTLGSHISLQSAIEHDMFFNRYISSGRYSLLVRRYIDYFPASQIYLFSYPGEGDNLVKRLNDLFIFLGVEPEPVSSVNKVINPNQFPLISSLHRASFYSTSRLIRFICSIFDGVNLYFGSKRLKSKISESEIEKIKQIFISYKEKEDLLALKNEYNLTGKLFLEEWLI